MADRDGVTIRRVQTPDEYAACVAIQIETWGEGFTERVPATILQVAQYVGGVTAGAFNADGRLLGFVFGMTGIRDGRLVHWSDLLAVRPEARDHGLGRRLKFYQRDILLPLGIETMYWTFDPLVARNAHLNLTRLGAHVAEYVPDLYGVETGSAVHGALGTDRFIVNWNIGGADRKAAPAAIASGGVGGGGHSDYGTGPETEHAPLINAPLNGDGVPVDGELIDAPAVRLEIPNDIMTVIDRDARVARRWRDTTRRAFLWYLARGYRVARFQCDPVTGRAFYRLAHP
ncbi:MAG: hypothetical protein ABR543_12170 [Gemmatimonadaceae bacterium]